MGAGIVFDFVLLYKNEECKLELVGYSSVPGGRQDGIDTRRFS